MARITIDLPTSFLFSTEITVRATDLNYGNHVGNDRILSYMQEIRVEFYRHLGFKSELNIDGPVGQIITDAAVVYKSEGFMGDVIIGSIAAADFINTGSIISTCSKTNTSTKKLRAVKQESFASITTKEKSRAFLRNY
jgi:acyl-CoA thioester hydrolase